MTTTPSAPSAPLATAQAVEAALGEASAAIDAARTLLRQGALVDLQGLEDHVERACSAIPGLEPDERQRLKPSMVSLIDALNTLTEDLGRQHKEISGTLQGLTSRRQAISAYKPRGGR